MNRDLENKFFAEFGIDGAADKALDMVLWKHCGINSGTSTRAERYNDDVFAEIAERTDSFGVWGCVTPVITEIKDNIDSRQNENVVNLYIGEILQKFSWWAFRYNRWCEGLNVIGNMVVNDSIEHYYHTWLIAYNSFAEKLAVILAEREISLEAIQEEYGVKIFDGWDFDKHWILFDSRERMKRVLSKIQYLKTKTLPTQLDTPKIRKVLEKAMSLELMDKEYNWEKSISLLAYFIKQMNDRFCLGKGLNADGSQRINWKLFEPLFGYTSKQYISAINEYKKTLVLPVGYEVVEQCFD